jgi:transposase-like protein
MPSPSDRSPFDRPRWTERDAREVLAALRRSGKPVSVFAAEHGLDPQRVYLWRRRLGGAERTTFQELIVRPAAGPCWLPKRSARIPRASARQDSTLHEFAILRVRLATEPMPARVTGRARASHSCHERGRDAISRRKLDVRHHNRVLATVRRGWRRGQTVTT